MANLSPAGSPEYTAWLVQDRRREHKNAPVPDAPVGLSAILDVSQIDVAWPIQQGVVVNLYRGLDDVFGSASIVQSFIDDSIIYADTDIPPTAYWYWLTVSNGAGESLPSESVSSRFIPTLAGSQYGTFDTAATYTAGEIEIEFSSASTAVSMFLCDSSAIESTRGWIWKDASGFLDWNPLVYSGALLDGVAATAGVTPFPEDGKIHKIKATLSGTVNIDTLAARFNFVNLFQGQILSIKFTDTSGAGDVVTNFVLDSGSITEQYARGSSTDKITLINFAADDWSRYTLQRNILHDAGTVAEAWVGDKLIDFPALTSQGTGWVFSGGVLHKNADDATLYDFGADVISANPYLLSYTKTIHSQGFPTLQIDATSWITNYLDTADGASGTFTEISTATASGTIKFNATGGRFDLHKFDVQHLLEIA